jgi:hypothetical protein
MDSLISIVNENNYALLLSLDLKTLQQLSYVNHRLYQLIKQNSFWYLKLEQDYLLYIQKWFNKKSYLGCVVYQDIIQNAHDYYLFYYHYHLYKDVFPDNQVDDLIKLFKMINYGKMQLNHILKLISITYQDETLENRMKTARIELLSNQLIIMSLIPFDVDLKFCIFDYLRMSFTYDHNSKKLFIDFIKPNLFGLIFAFDYLLNIKRL